ncbi:Transposase, partial [Desulfacinum infernum DSM 9756]
MKRKRFSKEFKAKVALEALKGQRTAIELAQEFGVHVNQISLWKKQLTENAAELFDRREAKKEKKREKERERLYQKVGQLQVE